MKPAKGNEFPQKASTVLAFFLKISYDNQEMQIHELKESLEKLSKEILNVEDRL